MHQYDPGSMTSTHSGHPLGCVASLASIDLIQRENLIENARIMGERLHIGSKKIQEKHSDIFDLQGRGLVYSLMALKDRAHFEPDADLAFEVILGCFEAGLLMFAPVGVGGECIKISPPLTITEDALRESIAVLEEAVDEVLG